MLLSLVLLEHSQELSVEIIGRQHVQIRRTLPRTLDVVPVIDVNVALGEPKEAFAELCRP